MRKVYSPAHGRINGGNDNLFRFFSPCLLFKVDSLYLLALCVKGYGIPEYFYLDSLFFQRIPVKFLNCLVNSRILSVNQNVNGVLLFPFCESRKGIVEPRKYSENSRRGYEETLSFPCKGSYLPFVSPVAENVKKFVRRRIKVFKTKADGRAAYSIPVLLGYRDVLRKTQRIDGVSLAEKEFSVAVENRRNLLVLICGQFP